MNENPLTFGQTVNPDQSGKTNLVDQLTGSMDDAVVLVDTDTQNVMRQYQKAAVR